MSSPGPDDEVDRLLAEQRAYYVARAPEYDDWWTRRGRYDKGEENTRVWTAEVGIAEAALERFAPRGRVLELAAGTGNWTQKLVRHADRVVAVDSSPETLALNAAKLGTDADRVAFVVADLFSWRPGEQFDVVFMSFWLSHVPPARLESFWDLVHTALAPGGRFYVLDNAHPRHQVGVPGSPVEIHNEGAAITHFDGNIDTATDIATRSLADGRTFDIVKHYWEPDELDARLGALGWTVDATTTGHLFLIAHGGRDDERP